MSELAGAWEAPPVVLASAGASLALFAQAFVRLRRRGRTDHAPWNRLALFVAAVAVATLALASPLDAAGEDYLLSAHMVQHVLVGDGAPALALAALRGPLVFFVLPGAVLARLARSPLRRVASVLVRPGVAFAVWAVPLGVWHVPRLYDYALTHQAVHDLEHASFVVGGVLVWTVLVDPARHGSVRISARLGLAAALFAAGQALSYVLLLSFSPLYGSYADQPERLLGLSPLADQRLAGGVMMLEQALTLGTAVVLLVRSARRRVAPARATA